jgi:DNA-binding response OmpR family regulator
LVEDDPDIRRLLTDFLPRYSVEVEAVSSCAAAREALAGDEFDLVLLDLQLPDGDGLTLAREIHDRGAPPVIIASGRQDEADRVLGLEIGADDYVTKPFSPRELLARIRAILRRVESGARTAQAPAPVVPADDAAARRSGAPRSYRFEGWELNLNTRRFSDPKGKTVPLTNSEFNLLVAFLQAPERVLTRDQLLATSRLHDDVFDRTIDVQILRLRRKMEVDPRTPRYIKTERGAGYVFSVPVESLR